MGSKGFEGEQSKTPGRFPEGDDRALRVLFGIEAIKARAERV
jgi:hypothetical protein